MNIYPALCTGCERWYYLEDEDTPCPNCFPGLTKEKLLSRIDELIEEVIAEKEAGTLPELTTEEKAILEGICSDFFAFQAAACTTQPDCTCGRDHS